MLFGPKHENARSRSRVVTVRLTPAEHDRLREAAWAARSSMNLFAITAIGREISRQAAARRDAAETGREES